MKRKLLFTVLSILILGSCTLNPSSNNANTSTLEDTSNLVTSETTSNDEVSNTSGDIISSSGNQNNSDQPSSDYREIDTHDEDRPFTCPNNAPLTYQDLFDLHNKVSITINVSTDQLLKLKNDFYNYEKSKIYRIANSVKVEVVRCDQTYTFEFDEVGIRLKGNTSRVSPVNDRGEIVNASHYKLSFTEIFDDVSIYGSDAHTYTETERLERGERSLLGLEKLDLKWNRSGDKSHIKEIYSYEIYRANGILTPYATLAKIKVDKESNSYDLGVYMIYETIDKQFIKRHLGEDQEYYNMGNWDDEKNASNGVSNSKYGDLYKATYGKGNGAGVPDMTTSSFFGSRIGEESNNGEYIPVYDRKSNKGTDDNVRLRNALKTLNEGTYADIEKVVDLQYFARYEAISYLVGDPDDLRNNYNNYYIYIRRTDGKMIIIPYDHDRVFGVCQDWNPSGNGMREVEMYSNIAVGNGDTQRNPLYLKTLLASSSNNVKTDYETYCKALKISRWFTSEKFNKYFELANSNYGNDYYTSSNGSLRDNQIEFTLKESGNYTFDDYVTTKLKHVSLEDVKPTPNPGDEDLTLYLVGNFNKWSASEKYLFYKQSSTVYVLSVNVDESFGQSIEFKINDGSWEGEIDWGFDSELNIVEGGENGIISGLYLGNTLNLVINLNIMKLSYTISGWSEPLPDIGYDYYFAFEENGWNNALGIIEYRFEKVSDDIYTYTFLATQNYNQLKFKIMCSSGILYGTDDGQTILVDSINAQTFKEYAIIAGQKIVVLLNTTDQTVTWSVQ